MQRLAVSILFGCVLLLPSWGHAQPVDCGFTGAGFDNGTNYGDFQTGRSCTTGGNGAGYTVNSCTVRIGAAPDGGDLRCAIYDNTADPNKALLCQAGPQAVTANADNTLTLTGCGTLSANTVYWITFNNNTLTMIYNEQTTVSCNEASGTDFFRAWTFGSAPSPWGTRTADPCDIIVRMSVTAVAGGAPRRALLGVGQ